MINHNAMLLDLSLRPPFLNLFFLFIIRVYSAVIGSRDGTKPLYIHLIFNDGVGSV